MKLSDIVGGTDITGHYLQGDSQFKIIRYQQNVYAVKIDENESATDYVHLWKSHKGSNAFSPKELTRGGRGTVSQKTADKAVKKPHGIFKRLFSRPVTVVTASSSCSEQSDSSAISRPARSLLSKGSSGMTAEKMVSCKSDLNKKILRQYFILKQEGLDGIFTFGLHTIKEECLAEELFIMPLVRQYSGDKGEVDRMFVDFILNLKRVNEMGLAHDDYCGSLSVRHANFANEMITEKGFTFVDLESGLHQIELDKDEVIPGYSVLLRDQWLIAYLNKYEDECGLAALEQWYEKTDYQPISQSPARILDLALQGDFRLPDEIIASLKEQVESSVAASASSSSSSSSSTLESGADLDDDSDKKSGRSFSK